MAESVTPMIHVPDVSATIDWYESVGFRVLNVYSEEGGRPDWAQIALGDGRVMFTSGGKESTAVRREVDLYVRSRNVDARTNV